MTDNESVKARINNAPDTHVDTFELTTARISITNNDDCLRYSEILKKVSAARKNWKEYWAPVLSPLRAALESANEKFASIDRRLKAVDDDIRTAISRWKINEAARESRLRAEAEAAADKEREALREAARKAARSGRMEQAQSLKSQAEILSAAPVDAPAPAMKGIAQVNDVEIEVTDLLAFLREVADGKVPLQGVVQGHTVPLIEVRISVLRELRKSMGDSFEIAGVEVKPKLSLRVRTK